MKLLLTGSLTYTANQIEEIRELGYDVSFLQDEREQISFDNRDVEVIVCNNLFLHNEITQFENLKAIQLTSTGMDRVPLKYIQEKKIKLFNAKDIYSIPMAEWVVLKILEIYKNSKFFYTNQNKQHWEKKRDLLELTDKKVGIIGYGDTGVEVAKRLKGFGTEITVINRSQIASEYIDRYVPLNQLHQVLPELDIIVLSIALTEDTQGLLAKEEFYLMKQNSVLINVARGEIINEDDLISALENKKFLGVALDVFKQEPLEDNRLWTFENIIITPHNAFISEKNNQRIYKQIFNNLSSVIKTPQFSKQ